MLVLALIVTLFSTLNVSDRLTFFIMAPCIELTTTNIVIAAFLPSVLVELKILYTSSRTGETSSKYKSGIFFDIEKVDFFQGSSKVEMQVQKSTSEENAQKTPESLDVEE